MRINGPSSTLLACTLRRQLDGLQRHLHVSVSQRGRRRALWCRINTKKPQTEINVQLRSLLFHAFFNKLKNQKFIKKCTSYKIKYLKMHTGILVKYKIFGKKIYIKEKNEKNKSHFDSKEVKKGFIWEEGRTVVIQMEPNLTKLLGNFLFFREVWW